MLGDGSVCTDCDWEEYRDKIESMLDGGGHRWAEDTLEGILDWITDNEHVTDKQKTAVENIESRGH